MINGLMRLVRKLIIMRLIMCDINEKKTASENELVTLLMDCREQINYAISKLLSVAVPKIKPDMISSELNDVINQSESIYKEWRHLDILIGAQMHAITEFGVEKLFKEEPKND